MASNPTQLPIVPPRTLHKQNRVSTLAILSRLPGESVCALLRIARPPPLTQLPAADLHQLETP